MYETLITKKGQELIAKALSSQTPIKLKEAKFSDWAGEININLNTLVSIKHTQSLNNVSIDVNNANTIRIEAIIPADIGGFYINTIGIYTSNDELFALAKIPQTYKSNLDENLATDLHFNFYAEIGNADSVSLNIDESIVLASREFVNESVNTLNESFNSSQRTQDAEIEKLKKATQNLNVYQKSETYTKNEIDTSQRTQDEKITALENNKADKTQLESYYTKAQNYTKDETNSLLERKVDRSTLSNYYLKTSGERLEREKANISDIETLTRNKANVSDIENILIELISQNTKLYNLANDLYKNQNQTPVGTILIYAGNIVPNGFLLCDGRELKKADYPELFSVISVTYGESKDKLSFKLPNLLNKSVLGATYSNLANTQALPVAGLQLQFDRSVTTITSKPTIANGRFTYAPTTNTELFTNMLELNENDLASDKEQISLYYIIKVY